MELGLNLVRVSPARMPELSALAEALGYESVFVPDHVALPVAFASKYPGTPDGSFPYPHDTPLYDPWVVLAGIAAATTTIRLGTAIYVLALRHPITAARAISTVDALSGGRVIVGIGVGWLAEEYATLGIDFRRRFSRTVEAVEVLRRLWAEPEPEFHGEHFSFDPIFFEPKPLCVPHPPILFGGDSDAALRRAVEHGDGWISGGVGPTVDDVIARIERITDFRDESGSDHPFQITVLDPHPDRADLERFRDAGVDRVVVMPWTSNREAPAAIERFWEGARPLT